MTHTLRQFVIVLIVLGFTSGTALASDGEPDGTHQGTLWTVDEALGQLVL